ncbi:MAG: hypothetical protein KDB00_28730, partial [Planctomycetales bacterium]|nr:hypothetical protein [Planctomycetales bacterium]
MIQLEAAHFSNLIGAIQRTGSLTGGAIRGLPNGVVIGGLVGVGSFASSLSDAQKEFRLGRPHTSLERVRQLENEFNGIAGRWNSTVQSVISNAKQGRQGIPLQRLNDVKNAQTRMQQLTGPVIKAFRDLVTALEHEIAMAGREGLEENAANESIAGSGFDHADAPLPELPDPFAADFCIGSRLRLQRVGEKKIHVVPQIEPQSHYYAAGFDPPRVIRVDNVQKAAIDVFDTHESTHITIDGRKLSELIKAGIWVLAPNG